MKILIGFIKPDAGHIEILGMDPFVEGHKIRFLIGYVPENVILYESLTPRELFMLIVRIRNLDPDKVGDRLEKLVDGFEFREYLDTMIGALSKGNKQKVALISALIHNPDLLILDEPLMGLDTISARLLKEIIKAKVMEGGTVLFSLTY